ncbi:protein kinase [Streptomyces sp. NBC_00286]|uniref:protein kinase n=1 Tax=Streptomyces sp. NBC_00286 TaxID=2975701 RepID=UPI002E2A4527|nr:protein kinase [Streptomyces sp. NBC_00286]
MDDYAGRVLADRYRLPLPPSDEYEFAESRAFDTYSGQEVLVRQVPLPEVVEAEVIDADGLPDGFVARDGGARRSAARPTRRPTEPAVRRAIEAAQAAAQIPDHPRLDQVFDVFAEGGSLWIVSELVPARPLAALLAERPLSPYRAAEVAADVLTALRVLHAHGWVHRNITVRTVLVCDDGRVMLTGLAAGAAEEALCGYDPVPVAEGERDGGPEGADSGSASGTAAGSTGSGAQGPYGPSGQPGQHGLGQSGQPGHPGQPGQSGSPGHYGSPAVPHTRVPGGDRSAVEAAPGGHGAVAPVAQPPVAGRRALEPTNDVRAARAGAIAAYRAGARAAARVHEEQRDGQHGQHGRHGENPALPGPRPRPSADGDAEAGQTSAYGVEHSAPPGQIADPYGVGGPNPWHGAVPRAGAPALPGNGQGQGQGRPALPGQANGAGTGIPGNGFGASGTGTDVPASGAALEARGIPTQPTDHHIDPQAPDQQTSSEPTRWTHLVPERAPHRGPTTALAAERARQARMAVVGPVTERWAPEQAGPVHENWQLAAPIGPATDLWALGALLFRAVQGHAPYPEENTAELVQLVCAEPPAFAEECGPLRPVVESLLRQDPTERLDFEELRGWLRSLVRSAPEPEAGTHVVAAPPLDATRLPVVRRRGEIVRKRRAGLPDRQARHKRQEKAPKPRRLGRTLLLLILLALAAAVAYAMVFMPKAEPDASSSVQPGAAGPGPAASSDTDPNPGTDGNAGTDPGSDETPSSTPSKENTPSQSSSSGTQTTGPELPQGFTLRKDSEGFSVAVARGWDRTPKNGSGQVIYSQGRFELLIVPGRDTASEYGDDPMTYQREEERELQPFRDSTWATSSGMRRIDVGGRTMAEGQFTWQDAEGREIYVRNLAILADGRYHVVQLRGPEAERDEVTRLFEQASATYQITG